MTLVLHYEVDNIARSGSMKKIIIGTIIVTTVVIILKQSGILDALLLFILVGAIPGSSTSLSPSMTLTLLTLSSVALFIHLTLPTILNLVHQYRLAKKRQSAKDKMPKRRFSEI